MLPPAALADFRSRAALAAVLLLTALAAGLRLWQAGESLWLDELHTAWCAGGDLTQVAPRSAIGNQSPLFFWLEWLLVRSCGASELTLRLPSVAAGSLLPLAVSGLAWRWTRSHVVSLTAAALVAVDHLAIFYATEARPYAVVQLLAVVHLAIATELVERPLARLRVAWIGTAALLFHLHYTTALLLPAELACWCVVRAGWPATTPYRLSMLLLDGGVWAALCLPAFPHLQAIFARRENWGAFVTPQPLWKLAEWFPWSLSVPVAIVALAAGSRHRRAVGCALAWLIVPAAIACAATAFDFARLFFPRYLVATAPAAILLAAICADLAPRRWSKWAVGVLLAIVAVWHSGMVEQFRYDQRVIGDRNENWRGAVQWLNEQLPRQPFPVLVASGLIEARALEQPHDLLLEDYCLLPITSLYPVAAARHDLIPLPFRDPERLEPAVRRWVAERGGAWLVVRGSVKDLRFAARGSGGESQEAIQQHRSFGNVQVILLGPQRPIEK
jgi:mannosyltransferase